MILKTAANYNDEGGYIEAWKNSDGTTEVKLIPKSGGGDEGKHGLKSITMSPAIETTPALDTFFPIYLENLTEDEKQNGVQVETVAVNELQQSYTITATPTEDWYCFCTSETPSIAGNQGEPISFEGMPTATFILANGLDPEAPDFEAFKVEFNVSDQE